MASIRRRSNKWQARVTGRNGGNSIAKSFLTKQSAEKWARQIELAYDQGEFRDASQPKDMCLRDLLSRYRHEVTPRKRSAPIETIRLKALEREHWTEIKLKELRPKHIADYRDRRLNEVSPSTVVHDLQLLSAAFNHAKREWQLIADNPISQIWRPSPNQGRDRILSTEEEAKLLTYLTGGGRRTNGTYCQGTRNPYVYSAVVIALETAMRRSELLGLTKRDIAPDVRTATLWLTKNGDKRVVPLSTRARDVISGLLRGDHERLLPITPMALRKSFERAANAIGAHDLHFHDLRHTATTRLAKRLPNLIELAAVTGHKDVRMLARYYHPDPCDLADKLD